VAYSCRILADNNNGVRITTFEITYPRFILSEFNTHRMLSKNTASSRAIPTKKLIESVKIDPVIPEFMRNKKGMQATRALSPSAKKYATLTWLLARNATVIACKKLERMKVHKQWTNRLIEPWLWTTQIVTATEWENFFALRADHDAQPEFQIIAGMMLEEYLKSPPSGSSSQGHLPFWNKDRDGFQLHKGLQSISHQINEVQNELLYGRELTYSELFRFMVCAGRCARVSYLSHDGRLDLVQDFKLARRLMLSGHWSPFEHVAISNHHLQTTSGNFTGWIQFRKFFENENRQCNLREQLRLIRKTTLEETY